MCNENIVEDEYNSLLPCWAWKVIRRKYNDLLDGHDNLSVIYKSSTTRMRTMCMHYCHIESFYYRVVKQHLRGVKSMVICLIVLLCHILVDNKKFPRFNIVQIIPIWKWPKWKRIQFWINWIIKEHRWAPQHLLVGTWPTIRHSFGAHWRWIHHQALLCAYASIPCALHC